jgi:enamine deaminase RidA (YjgF/YER057c/UK114 family)
MPTIPDITPPDYNTVVGQIRLLIPDMEQLHDLSNNIKKAAAQAKLLLATSETLINKVIKTADYSTDGAKLGAELRAQAKALQDEAREDEQLDAYDSAFVVVPYSTKWDNAWL